MTLTKDRDLEFKPIMTLSREALKLYAEGSLDPNPIHLDDEVAKKAGLKSVIAHGMLVAGLVANRVKVLIQDELNEEWTMTNFQIRFKAISYPGETIEVGGKVAEADESRIEISLKARSSEGEIKTTATVTLSKV